MYRIELQIDLDVIEAIQEGAREVPGIMNTIVKRNLSRAKGRFLAQLREEPGPPQYPLRWKSAKQRRFVMAKLRSEGGIPYVRSHDLSQGYDMELRIDADGGEFIVTNDVPYHMFVSGDFAQPMMLDTGWVQTSLLVTSFEDELTDILIESWFTAVDATT